jgi:hypothetical protein
MIYYTTVILLHRSFIPGPTQTNLPISLPSYRICESAANSILDIVNIMLGENHLRYSYNFTVYFVFTAGIIFIKLASSDDADHAFDAKININRTMRALDDLEVTWLNAARCCNILGELAGLRDINLECDEFVPRKIAKKSPPPSIAVPNSPELNASAAFNSEGNDDKSRNASRPAAIILTEDRPFNHSYTATFSDQNKSQIPISSVRQSNNQNNSSNNNKSSRSASIDQLHSNFSSPSTPGFSNTTPTMDPFAAPGIIPGTAQQQQQQQQFDPLGTAFWGMPSSLDTDEWNTYFGNQINPQQQQQQSDTQQLSSLLSAGGSLTSSSFLFNSPPSDYQQRRGKEDTSTKTPTSMNMFSTPITAAESTNSMPMSIDLPNSPSQSVLLGFMDNNNGDVVTSPSPIQQNDRVNSTSNELNYW